MRGSRRKSPLVPVAHADAEEPGSRPASATLPDTDQDAVTRDGQGPGSSSEGADRLAQDAKRQRTFEPAADSRSVSPLGSSVSPPLDHPTMLPPGAANELRARAWRILSTSEGQLKATADPPVVKAALDGLVVLAQDAIEYHRSVHRGSPPRGPLVQCSVQLGLQTCIASLQHLHTRLLTPQIHS